jgi:uncharacterized protein YndB with AHSA1/START domain
MTTPFGHPILHRSFIAAPIEKVFETISSSSGWDAFFTTGMTLDCKRGGEMTFRWKNWGAHGVNVSAKGLVVEVVPPRLFVFQWFPVQKDQPTTITFQTESVDGGTVIQVTEDGYPDTPDGRHAILDCACGWGEAVTLLKMYLEHGVVYTRRMTT